MPGIKGIKWGVQNGPPYPIRAHYSSPTGMLIGVQSSDPELWIGDKSYMMYSTIVPNQADPSQYIDYAIPVGDLQSQEKITQIFDTDTSFHYEFDLTILVASAANDDGVHEIFADTVHVTTPVYLTDMG